MITFTEAQALALITDPGTLKRGEELVKPTKWANLARTDTAAWGECAGSGSKPYLTGIDLTEPAFKCSCPSRVFPCKHGAGLLLLMVRQPALLASGTPPVWLEEWLAKRHQTQEKKAEKAAPAKVAKAARASQDSAAGNEAENMADASLAAGEDPEDFDAPAGLTVDSKRLARMHAGADDLMAWLEDLMRTGLATLDQQPAKFWESQAARLVDNQLPGLAGTVRELAPLRHAHADWPPRLLGRLGELYLLVRAFQHLPALGPEARADVLQQVGINLKKEDLLATAAPVADAWRVLGQFRWEEDRLTARRTWLHGRATGHTALVLEFAFGSQAFGTPFIPQGSYLGELAFYPGLLPLRAAPVQVKFDGSVPASAVPAGQSISQLLHDYAAALARQPWLREWPATLSQVHPTPLPDGSWQLHHATEPGILPLRLVEEDFGWQLLAESSGLAVTLFGEWDGRAFRPLSSWGGASANTSSPAPLQKRGEPDDSSSSSKDAPSSLERGPALKGSREVVPNGAALLRIALLGTRQSGEAVPAFPAAAASPEQQLLLAAGTLALMRKAGYRPARPVGPALAPAPPELLPAIGPKGSDYLHQMLVNSLHLNLLPDYLTRLAARNRRVPTALLVPLLQHAHNSSDTRPMLAAVLGSRGHWLAALNPEWAKLSDGTAAPSPTGEATATWETGTLTQRSAWLTERFGQAPAEARALLLAALPTEPAKNQEAFLEILSDHLHPDAEATLETLLRARGQEVRRLAAGLLVRLPGAALTERLWARAAPLLSFKHKLLGKNTLEVTLPTDWDKTWLLDGIEEKNARYLSFRGPGFNTPIGPATARLANLLALLPPSRWATHLGHPPAELLAAALASEWAVPLLPVWAESTVLHQDAAFATAFLDLWLSQLPRLKKLAITLPAEELMDVLPAAAQRDTLFAPLLARLQKPTGSREADWEVLQQAQVRPGPWPWPYAQAALQLLARHMAGTALSHPQLPYEWRLMGYFVSQTLPDKLALADTAATQQLLAAIPDAHEFYREHFESLNNMLHFRSELEASLQE